MTLEQFIARWSGESASYDGLASNKGQCVQLVEFYITEALGLNPFYGDAIEWWDNFGGSLAKYFDRIPYTPGVVAKKGDLCVWESSLPGSGGAGHIDIVIEDGDQNSFTGFDSNWGALFAHVVRHNYTHVKGLLRPKGNEMYGDGDAKTWAERANTATNIANIRLARLQKIGKAVSVDSPDSDAGMEQIIANIQTESNRIAELTNILSSAKGDDAAKLTKIREILNA